MKLKYPPLYSFSDLQQYEEWWHLSEVEKEFTIAKFAAKIRNKLRYYKNKKLTNDN